MIKTTRHGLIILSGGLLAWSLATASCPVLSLIASAYFLLWLTAGAKVPQLSFTALPLSIAALLFESLHGVSAPIPALLFLLLLAAWETDQLCRQARGASIEGNGIKLLLPLFLREVLGLILVLAAYYLTRGRTLNIGFLPLCLIVLLLIFVLKKLFKAIRY